MTYRFGLLWTFGTLTFVASTGQAQELPIPCVTCTGGPGPFVSSGEASYVIGGATATVTQTTERAILNWQSFNIGANGTVNFLQPSATSAALNRIFQADPSRIFGTLNANGQVYLINQNGILFGSGAQVNAGSLIASTLDVTDQVFNGLGIVGAINNDLTSDQSAALAAFEGQSDAAINIEQGARLRAGERIIVVAADIENRGRIETPDGQAILAASHDKVYLASDRELRGLLVEVDTGGSVTNLGEIIADRGNATLAGLAVNQSGRISASTSVSAGGSIRLLARDGARAELEGGVRKPSASRSGTLVLGEDSLTEILPDRASRDTAIDLQAQPLSRVDAAGGTIEMRRGAEIVATGGNVTLRATAGADAPPEFRPTIYLADGSRIDVSGDDTSVLSMERHQGRIKLFGNELADSPVQRGGPLSRQDIAVDLRYGTRITDISRLRDDIKRGVGERLSAGGSVTLDAQGPVADVILDRGSTIDFSGGQVRYEDGYLEVTRLVDLNGGVVDIANADPNTPYAGIQGNFRVRHERWGVIEEFRGYGGGAEFHSGYVEGKDAGRLTISATGIAAEGTLAGATVAGTLQRELPSGPAGLGRSFDQLPLGGWLDITRGGVLPAGTVGLRFDTDRANAHHEFGVPLAEDLTLQLSALDLTAAGINRLRIDTPGSALLPEDVNLAFNGGADLSITADDIELAGDITAPSGRLSFTTRAIGTQLGSLHLTDTATLDVSGTWVNDLPEMNGGQAGTAPLATDGGQVSLTARGDLTLDAGSVIDVSGSAQLRANATLAGGSGGTISLTSNVPGQAVPTELALNGTLRGFAFDTGGRLRLSAAEFRIGDIEPPMPGEPPRAESSQLVELAPSFFQSGGFAHYELTADRGSIVVEPGAALSIEQRNFQVQPGAQFVATGADVDGFLELTTLPDPSRAATSFSATIAREAGIAEDEGLLRIGAGASITTEARGSISLASDSDLSIGGELTAHGGTIRATLNNPATSNERGFRADQALRIGPQATLDVSGIGRTVTDSAGVRSGDVLDGGQVTLTANRGFVITSDESRIDVSGTQVELDLPGENFGALTPTRLASNAGAIRATAAEGALLFGEMLGAPGGENAAAGTLAVTIDATRRDPGDVVATNPSQYAQFPTAAREIVVGGVVSGDFAEGVDIPAFLHGKGIFSAAAIGDGSFDAIDLSVSPRTSFGIPQSMGQIRFDGDVSLVAGRRITLDAAIVASSGQEAIVRAPYVSIGPSQPFRGEGTPLPGGGTLRVDADHIDLFGHVALSGFAAGGDVPAIRLASTGDIRMIGRNFNGDGASLPGSLTSLADVSLHADQIYPATLTDYSVRVLGADGRIVVSGGDAAARAPSAAGRLSFSAAEIVQGGVVRAPFGEISFDASRALTLADGSLTSTSAAGTVVPFGTTEFGESWVYPLGELTRVFEGVPEAGVRLSAPEVDIARGSSVDISGGGDLLASEFVRGPGGTRDILLGNNPEGSFAVVPGWSLFGAYDLLESSVANIEVGSTIEIGRGSALPAGVYARLPARYALLPGAYLVTPSAGPRSVAAFGGGVAADGITPLVAGRSGFAGTDVHASQWSSYTIQSGAQVRRRAEYTETLASAFFTDGAASPRDAGRLAIEAQRSIRIEGSLAAAASGGRAAQVDFVADDLAVVRERTDDETRVELVASELEGFGAASLLLGGTRSRGEEGIEVDVSARTVTVESGAVLAAPELMLTAREDITVEAGARLTGRGTIGSTEEDPQIELAGDSAFLRVAAGDLVDVVRTGASGQAGRITVEESATLQGDGSIMLDATRDVVSAGDLLASGGSLSLATSRISIGDAAADVGGLTLSQEDLARFRASELILSSRSTIDFHGSLDTGLDSVWLDAARVQGFGDADVRITARELTLGNSGNASAVATGDGTGSLAMQGESVTLAAGAVAVNGFEQVILGATREIVGENRAQLGVDGDLILSAPRITAASGADAAISATGSIATAAVAAPANLAPVDALGARLTLTASDIQHGGRIELPSGIVAMQATGVDGIALTAGSSVSTRGRELDFAGTSVGSNGGRVDLIANQGPVRVEAGASIDISGAGQADAGRISIASAGEVRIDADATLTAQANAVATQGTFELAAAALASDFSVLNRELNDGGFTARRAFSLGTGNVSIDAGETVDAKEFELATNGGRIDVAGTIDAANAGGGTVRLSARDGIALAGTALIDASAQADAQAGGRVELSTGAGGAIDSRGRIDVAGRDADGNRVDDGHVNLRAPRVGSTDINVAAVGDIDGAARVDLEAFATYNTASVSPALLGTIRSDTSAFMANAEGIEQRLGIADDPRYHVIPGVDVVSAGDLAMNTAWDLAGWRDGGETGVLTLRAARNLNVNRTLSDGFVDQALDFLPERSVIQTGPSWSYRLVAGAATTSADPLATMRGVGNVTVAGQTVVRTGTGSIDITAGSDLVLATNTSAIYTAGSNRGTGAIDPFDAEVLLRADFVENGGDVRVSVGRDVRGVTDQTLPDYLPRLQGEFIDYRAGTVFPSSWAIDASRFTQGIGTLGGGDISIVAGGAMDSLTLALPTNALPYDLDGSDTRIAGGGDLRVDVGGDVRGGAYLLGRGHGEIRSGGRIGPATSGMRLSPIVGLGDADIELSARTGVSLETVFNPTVAEQNPEQGLLDFFFFPVPSYFFTYSERSAVSVSTLTGDALLQANGQSLIQPTNGNRLVTPALVSLFPGRLSARSLQGDIVVRTGINLFPSVSGTLELLAGEDVTSRGAGAVNLSDGDVSLLPDIANPVNSLTSTELQAVLRGHAPTPVHAGDPTPALIVAREGSVGPQTQLDTLSFSIAKPARVVAGEDVSNLTLHVQHHGTNDATEIVAGRDIVYSTLRNAAGNLGANTNVISVSGPGRVDLLAGRDVDFGSAAGVETRGDLSNPALADDGADINIWTGQADRPDFAGFTQRFLRDSTRHASALRAYLDRLGVAAGASDVTAFEALPESQRRVFLAEVLFAEIKRGGLGDNDDAFAAIRAMFPTARKFAGDLRSFLSHIRTVDGGDINLIVPGGLVNAGVASSGAFSKAASELGVIAQRDGDVNAFTRRNFLVNASRVFALDGGDILIWSSEGNIDAGRGARSALAIPPPVTTFDAQGNVLVEFPAAVSGSGIRAAVTTPGRRPGDVYLFAPAGVVDAGEAGIASAGNVTIVATEVIGADNIEVGGVAVGIPVDTGGLATSLASVSSVASSASSSTLGGAGPESPDNQAPIAEAALGWLDVFVLGFGDETCKSDDTACLERNRK